MGNYNIIKLKQSEYDFLIIANSYENPVNDLIYQNNVPFIENGFILFDLTVVNGLSNNRYAYAQVNNHKIIVSSIGVMSNVDDAEILKITSEYFLHNSNIIKQSHLPSTAKYIILNKQY